MSSLSSSQNSLPPSTDSMIIASQLSSMQALDNEQQESNKTQKREQDHYVKTRTLEHARTEEGARKDALTKGRNVARTHQAQVAKSDSLKTAGEEIGNSLVSSTPKKNDPTRKPQMPSPSTPFGSGDTSDDDCNVMAIIGRVLVLVANVQVNGWKTFWKMGSENVTTSFQMSQAEAKNTELQYSEQASATRCQADQYAKDGMMQISNFGMCVGMGVLGGPEENELNKPNAEDTNLTNRTEAPTNNGVNPDENSLSASELNATDDTPQNAENAETEATGRAQQRQEVQEQQAKQKESKLTTVKNVLKKGFRGFGSGSSDVQKFVGRIMGNGWRYAQVITPGMTGMQNLLYDKPIQNKKATHEGLMGQFAASATLARGYAEYNNQIFNRNEDIRQQTNQGVDYAMNIFKSASDALTQAVSTMAR